MSESATYHIAVKSTGNKNLADWPQPVRIKILADFNLAEAKFDLAMPGPLNNSRINIYAYYTVRSTLQGVSNTRK